MRVQERPVPVYRRGHAGALAAGLRGVPAATQAVERRRGGGQVRVAVLRVGAVAAEHHGVRVLRALRPPPSRSLARSLRLRAPPAAHCVRRLPSGQYRSPCLCRSISEVN